MASYPTPWTITRYPCIPGDDDGLGNEEPTFGPPVTQRIQGYYMPSVYEQLGQYVSREIVDVLMFVPPDFVGGPRDQYSIPGQPGKFEQIGHVRDYTKGPYGFKPGMLVELKRVTG